MKCWPFRQYEVHNFRHLLMVLNRLNTYSSAYTNYLIFRVVNWIFFLHFLLQFMPWKGWRTGSSISLSTTLSIYSFYSLMSLIIVLPRGAVWTILNTIFTIIRVTWVNKCTGNRPCCPISESVLLSVYIHDVSLYTRTPYTHPNMHIRGGAVEKICCKRTVTHMDKTLLVFIHTVLYSSHGLLSSNIFYIKWKTKPFSLLELSFDNDNEKNSPLHGHSNIHISIICNYILFASWGHYFLFHVGGVRGWMDKLPRSASNALASQRFRFDSHWW